MSRSDPICEDAAFDHLHYLVKKGDVPGVRTWLRGGGDPNLLNRFGWSLLMLAALHGRTGIALALIESGADPHLKNRFGDTAVRLAADKGFRRTVEVIERAAGKGQ
ncbi:MAG: ankyrin repeat domain-containing protein [Acidobacteriia bacterium]|nr:ankyrin repeat domain-containing protein [Terriglobia bacterium]